MKAEVREFDAIVVGAGILGCVLFAKLCEQGARTLLIDRSDFGGGTSLNSLRILHGGLRYLQSGDIKRFFESVNDRRWFCRNFPEAIERLPCILFLDESGLRTPTVLRAALLANDMLSFRRNADVAPDLQLPRGRILQNEELAALFPSLDVSEVNGGAEWTDAQLSQPVRVVMELVRRGMQAGGSAMNYCEAGAVDVEAGAVVGLRARDLLGDRDLEFRTQCVFNTSGPDASRLAGKLTGQTPKPFPLTLAWNTLFDIEPPGDRAIAVTGPIKGVNRSYVIVPKGDKTLIGTGQVPFEEGRIQREPTPAEIDEFNAGVKLAIPSLSLDTDRVEKIFSGLVPASVAGVGDFAHRPWVVDHSDTGGPEGLITAASVKFTTAHSVAVNLIKRGRRLLRFGGAPRLMIESGSGMAVRMSVAKCAQEPEHRLTETDDERIMQMAAEEGARSAEDLVYRRLGVIDDQRRACELISRYENQFRQLRLCS